jgi:hypothetical protein
VQERSRPKVLIDEGSASGDEHDVLYAAAWEHFPHHVFEHAVENMEHEMSHRDDRAFFIAPWR